MTSENSTERLSGVNLKHRFLSVLVAVGAKPMRRLIGCLCWIERVHKGSVTNLPKRVTGALLLPFVVCCKLSLECYYALGFLLIESLNTHCLSVEIKQHLQQFGPRRVPYRIRFSLKECLRYVGYMTDGDDECGDFVHSPDVSLQPNDPSSATRPTRALDCNLDAMAGFAAAH